MNPQARFFWATALFATLGYAAATYYLLPYDALRAATDAERYRVWLLTLWTTGVFGVLFGMSALLGAFRGVGFSDIHSAGGVQEAVHRHRASLKRAGGEPFHGSFGWWTVCTGLLLIAAYFVAWTMRG
jgi:hypothetical protein